MGNSKSKKLKITDDAPSEDTKNKEERINKIKSDIPEAPYKSNDGGEEVETNKEKEHDNASSASTVEVLDDK